MKGKLVSQRVRVRDVAGATELFWDKGWSDGLPIIPPTEDRVLAFLDYANLEPDQVVGEVPERNRILTAEKVAINAVMAGCLPEYMSVIVAAVEAITDPIFRFNRLASLGGAWPTLLVNGPVVKELKISSGSYIFGGLDRANVTIARAVSLLLQNCADARKGGTQAGQWGNFVRGRGVLAENEDIPDLPWTPLHVQLGFSRETSVVTVVSLLPHPFAVRCRNLDPERILDAVSYYLPDLGFYRGPFVLLVPPDTAGIFHSKGWSKDDIRRYVMANSNSKRSIAQLKLMNRWGGSGTRSGVFVADESTIKIEPGDEEKYVYLFRDNPEYNPFLFSVMHMADKPDILIMVCGGIGYLTMYLLGGAGPSPVSRPIHCHN